MWVDISNIIDKSKPRNFLISEIFRKTWLVEQSWQWVDRIIKTSIKEGKWKPSYEKSDNYNVVLQINAFIKDKEFISYIYKVSNEKNINISLEDLIILQNILDNKIIKKDDKIDYLLKNNLIENRWRWKYMLSKKYYSDIWEKWEYTKLKWLERDKIKELILNYIKQHNWLKKSEFNKAFDDLTLGQIDRILNDLSHKEKKIFYDKDKKVWCLVVY